MFQLKAKAAIESKHHTQLTTAFTYFRSDRSVKICRLYYFKFPTSDLIFPLVPESNFGNRKSEKYPTSRLSDVAIIKGWA